MNKPICANCAQCKEIVVFPDSKMAICMRLVDEKPLNVKCVLERKNIEQDHCGPDAKFFIKSKEIRKKPVSGRGIPRKNKHT